MECFTIGLVEEMGERCCPKCGVRYAGRGGLGLFTDDHDEPVCRSCGKKCAPTMIALLDLAQTAERVGSTMDAAHKALSRIRTKLQACIERRLRLAGES